MSVEWILSHLWLRTAITVKASGHLVSKDRDTLILQGCKAILTTSMA